MTMEQKESEVVVSPKLRNYPKIIKRTTITLLILIILTSLSFYVYHLTNKKKAIVSLDPCTSDTKLLNSAASAFINNNLNTERQLTTRVKSLTNYQKDPNCLYIVTNYYINNGNESNAAKYLNQLQKVYNPKVGFSPKLMGTYSLSQLTSDINTMNQNAKQVQQNGITFSSPK